MKSLFFCFYTAYPVTGGASSVTYQLARHWPGERTLVQIGPDAGDANLANGFRVVTLPFEDGGRVRKLWQIPGWVRSMERIACEAKPDLLVLEGASWVAYLWLLLRHLRRALPDTRVVEERPQARFAVIGGDVPYRQPWLVNPGLLPNAELPAVIRAASVSIAPIFSGSGTRLKIIESLVAGTPVVTTAKGMEGLLLDPGAHILTAESAEQFASQIAHCLDVPTEERARCRTCIEVVRKRYDWASIVRRFIDGAPHGIERRLFEDRPIADVRGAGNTP